MLFASFFDGLWKGVSTASSWSEKWSWQQIPCDRFPCSGAGAPVPGIKDTSECSDGVDQSSPAPEGASALFAFPPDDIAGPNSHSLVVAGIWNRTAIYSTDFGDSWIDFTHPDSALNPSNADVSPPRWTVPGTVSNGPRFIHRMSF